MASVPFLEIILFFTGRNVVYIVLLANKQISEVDIPGIKHS